MKITTRDLVTARKPLDSISTERVWGGQSTWGTRPDAIGLELRTRYLLHLRTAYFGRAGWFRVYAVQLGNDRALYVNTTATPGVFLSDELVALLPVDAPEDGWLSTAQS